MLIQLIKEQSSSGGIGFILRKGGFAEKWFSLAEETEARTAYNEMVKSFSEPFKPEIIEQIDIPVELIEAERAVN